MAGPVATPEWARPYRASHSLRRKVGLRCHMCPLCDSGRRDQHRIKYAIGITPDSMIGYQRLNIRLHHVPETFDTKPL